MFMSHFVFRTEFLSTKLFITSNTTLISVRHHDLLYNIIISLGYMFRLFSVIIRPYLEH